MSLRTAIASCVAAAAFALSAPVLAQTEGGLETQLQENEDQGQGTGQGLQQGQGQIQGQSQGQQPELETTRYEDWLLQCRPGQGQQPRARRMAQSVSSGDGENRIMQVIVANAPQQGPVANFFVPLGVFLQKDPAVKVDGNQIGTARYISCVQQGCVAQLRLDDAALTAMRRGQQLQITLTGQRGQSRDVSASLLGFTNAYNDLTS